MKKKDKVETLQKFGLSKTCIYSLPTKLDKINDDTPFLRQVGIGGHNKKLSVRNEVQIEMDFNHQISANIVGKVQQVSH